MKTGAWYRVYMVLYVQDMAFVNEEDLDQGISAICDDCDKATGYKFQLAGHQHHYWREYWEAMGHDRARCLVCGEECTGW